MHPTTADEIQRGRDGWHRWEWESPTDLFNFATRDGFALQRNRKGHNRVLADMHLRQMRPDSSFYGGHTVESLREALITPRPSILETIEAIADRITTAAPIAGRPRRRIRHFREYGSELDPIAHLCRLPNGWSEAQREPAPASLVRIGVNLSISAKRKPHELLYRGAAALALADRYAAAGYSVEIVAFDTAANLGHDRRNAQRFNHLLQYIIIKSAGKPLDVSALATALCDVGFIRGLMMTASARLAPVKICDLFGSEAPLPDADRSGFHYILDTDIRTEAAALAAVNRASTDLDRATA